MEVVFDMANESGHMFSTDRPIDKIEEDQLDRANFAKAIATAISNWREKDSLVVGLYGPWGCGKSSVINMTVDVLDDQKDKVPEIVRFNPWQVSGQGEIVAAFFQELRPALKEAGMESSVIIKVFDPYSSVLKLAGPAASLAASVGYLESGIAAVLVAGAILVRTISNLFGKSRKASKTPRESLSSMKKTLKGHMQDLERPILVVIDDIDRLTADEIRLVFRLVKANADFPNMVYLLGLQGDVVARALEESDAGRTFGEEYMAKVIQVPFSIPAIDRYRLLDALSKGLGSAFDDESLIIPEFEKTRWSQLFTNGLSPFFESLRDVKRLVSMLNFHVGLFRNGNVLEVNPIDLIALEVFRIFEPAVYRQLPHHKEILLTSRDGFPDYKRDNIKKRLLDIVSTASPNRQDSVKAILQNLFPLSQWAFDDYGSGTDTSEQWLRALRVCHEDNFYRYFTMHVPQTDFSQADLERLLAKGHDTKATITELRELHNRGILSNATKQLGANLDRIEHRAIVPFAKALFAVGEDVCGDDAEQSGLFSIPLTWELSSLAEKMFRQISDESERCKALMTAIETSKYLYVPAILLNRETLRRTESNHGVRLFDKDEDLSSLTDAWTGRLRSLAEATSLCETDGLGFILKRWKEWGSIADAQTWAGRAIETESCVLALLRGFLHSVRSTDSSGARINYHMRLEEIEDFVVMKDLKPKVDAIDLEALSEIHRIAVETFFEAVRRRGDDDYYDAWSRGDY